MRFQVDENDDACQSAAQYRNPPVVVQQHHGAPLLNCSGLVLIRQLMERLCVVRAIDAGVRVLRRCKWYRESDHILTLIYSMLSGGSRLHDVNRLGQDEALTRVLGSDRIPHATTIGKFLWRFGDDEHDKQRLGLAELRDTSEAVQQDAFGLLARKRRKVATLDWDSSIHEVYGQKKGGGGLCVRQYVELQRLVRDPCRDRRCALSGAAGRPSVHQLWDQGSAAGNDRTGEQALLRCAPKGEVREYRLR